MGLGGFFERRRQSKSFQRQIKAQGKLGILESRAATFEREAELTSGITKQREKIRKARQTIFERSPIFRAFAGTKKVVRKATAAAKPLRKIKFGGLVQEEDIFLRRESSPRRRKKKSKIREAPIEEDIFFGGEQQQFF